MLFERAEQPAEQFEAARDAEHPRHFAFALDRDERAAELAQVGREIPAALDARQQAEHAQARGAADREQQDMAARLVADFLTRQYADRGLTHVAEADNDRLGRQPRRIEPPAPNETREFRRYDDGALVCHRTCQPLPNSMEPGSIRMPREMRPVRSAAPSPTGSATGGSARRQAVEKQHGEQRAAAELTEPLDRAIAPSEREAGHRISEQQQEQ